MSVCVFCIVYEMAEIISDDDGSCVPSPPGSACEDLPDSAESATEDVTFLPQEHCCNFGCFAQLVADSGLSPRVSEIKVALAQERDRERRNQFMYELVGQWYCHGGGSSEKSRKQRRFNVFGVAVCRATVAKLLNTHVKQITEFCNWADLGHTKPGKDLRCSDASGHRIARTGEDPAVTSAHALWAWAS